MSHSGVKSLRTKNEVNKLTGEYGGESYYQGVEIRDADVHSSMLPLINRELEGKYKVYNPVRHDYVRYAEIRDSRFDDDQPYKESDNYDCLYISGSEIVFPNSKWKRNNVTVELQFLDKVQLHNKFRFNTDTPFVDFDSTSLISPIEYAGVDIVDGLEYIHRDDHTAVQYLKNIIDPMTVRTDTLDDKLVAPGEAHSGGIFGTKQNIIVFTYDITEKTENDQWFYDSYDFIHCVHSGSEDRIDPQWLPLKNLNALEEKYFYDEAIADRFYVEPEIEQHVVDAYAEGDINPKHVQMSTGFTEYSGEKQDSMSYRGLLR